MEKIKSTRGNRPTIFLLISYSLLSWAIFKSTLSGMGLGNTLASFLLWPVLISILFYGLVNLSDSSNCFTMAIVQTLAIRGLLLLYDLIKKDLILDSTLVPYSLLKRSSPWSITIICGMISLALTLLIRSHRANLLCNISKNVVLNKTIKKATSGLYSMGRYCSKRLFVTISVALVSWSILKLTSNPMVQYSSYMSIYCSIPMVGWIVACFMLFITTFNSYGLAYAILTSSILALVNLILEQIIYKKLFKESSDYSLVALVSLCTYAIFGPACAFLSGGVFHGIRQVLITRPAGKILNYSSASK